MTKERDVIAEIEKILADEDYEADGLFAVVNSVRSDDLRKLITLAHAVRESASRLRMCPECSEMETGVHDGVCIYVKVTNALKALTEP
jgi:hypothetical protein